MPPLTESARAAQTAALARLGYLQVGILDTDINNAQLIRKVLSTIGITHTHLSRDSSEMTGILIDRQVDIFITEWDCRPESGIELSRYLRSAASPNRMLPIILTTTRTSPEDHHEAVDAGINEIVVKPFNVRQILGAVLRIIDQPKAFILARGYTGPDRRGKTPPPPGIPERRSAIAPLILSKSAVNETFLDDHPRLVLPDYSLKQKLDAAASLPMAGIEHILGPSEAGKRAQDYNQWMLKDLQTIRQNYHAMTTGGENVHGLVERICEAAMSIRTLGLRSGYIFASRAATGLNDFCQKRLRPDNKNHLQVIEKHIETLQAILNARLTGDDNPVGREIMAELQSLVKKYS